MAKGFVKPTKTVRRPDVSKGDHTCPSMSNPDYYVAWECERQGGHKGKHMAWSDYSTGELYEGGLWK